MNGLDTWKSMDKGTKIKLGILFAAGLLLILLSRYFGKNAKEMKSAPFSTSENTNTIKSTSKTEERSISYEEELEIRLQAILSEVEEAGEVLVMVTATNSSKKVVMENKQEDISHTLEVDKEGGRREVSHSQKEVETVIIRSQDGGEEPIILEEKKPKIEGVIIVSPGGDDPYVRERLIRATQAALGVDIHKVEVLKRK